MKQAFIGRSVQRLEDLPLLMGEGRFARTTSFPGELHMRIVRSPFAHGRLLAIDAAKARAAPGCVAVWTFADVAEVPPIEFRLTRVKGLEPYRQRVLAHEAVRYVGEHYPVDRHKEIIGALRARDPIAVSLAIEADIRDGVGRLGREALRRILGDAQANAAA